MTSPATSVVPRAFRRQTPLADPSNYMALTFFHSRECRARDAIPSHWDSTSSLAAVSPLTHERVSFVRRSYPKLMGKEEEVRAKGGKRPGLEGRTLDTVTTAIPPPCVPRSPRDYARRLCARTVAFRPSIFRARWSLSLSHTFRELPCRVTESPRREIRSTIATMAGYGA